MWSMIGSWYQGNKGLDLEIDPREGSVAVIREVVFRATFYGFLIPELELREDNSEGWIKDTVGKALLFEVSVTPQGVAFKKQYDNRAVIQYTFSRQVNGIWVGTYTGEAVGNGTAWAAITPIESWLFNERKFAALMKRESVHEWPNVPAGAV